MVLSSEFILTDKTSFLFCSEEMGILLENCFCQALLDAKKIELPILVSKFSSQYLHAAW